MRKWRIEDSEELYNITGCFLFWNKREGTCGGYSAKGRSGCGSEGIGGRTSA